jgi:hypothetical protein
VAQVIEPAPAPTYALPTAVAKLDPQARALADALAADVVRRAELDRAITARVLDLRAIGVSWHVIGYAVGTSGEAARQRWGST